MQSKGFTIIELLITIFILSIGVIGIYGAFSAMIVFTNNASDQLQAAYLAQEGIEIIRNIRDTNWLQAEVWNTGLDSCESGCEADYKTTGDLLNPVDTSFGDFLYKNNDGLYGYAIGENFEESKFKRKITITPVPNKDYAMDVVIEVSWSKKKDLISDSALAGDCLQRNCVTVQEILYDWY